MKKRMWSLADLLDLEFFFSRDRELLDRGEDEAPRKRDRRIYLAVKDSCPQHDETELRSCLLRRWLSVRRADIRKEKNGQGMLPGQLFGELMKICSWAFFLLSFVGGWGMALSFLSYSGKTPVNVATFLALFVVSQIFVLVILLFFLTAGRLRTRPALPLTYSLVRKVVFFLALKISRFTQEHGPTGRLLAALSGNVHRFGELYGPIFILPFFLLVQLAGIGFNLGVEAAILLKVVGTDVAFGWQSTLQPGAEAVFHLVQLIALPWSWALPAGIAYPDLAQIQGSQMVLKEGIYRLSTGNLVSWWPFLCLCVAVYGLLPRLVLYCSGRFTCNLLLHRLKFDSAAHRQVLHRMLTPRLSTTVTPDQPETQQRKTIKPEERKNVVSAGKQCLILIPEEIFTDCPRKELAEVIKQQLGMEPGKYLSFDSPDVDEAGLSSTIEQTLDPTIDSLVILQEAWQPPIEEFFSFIDQLRVITGKKILITIALIGKPASHTIFTRVRDQDYAIWQQRIVAKGDPYMQSIRLVTQ